MSSKSLFAVVLVWLSLGAVHANAITVWDESLDGDLAGVVFGATNIGSLGLGTNTVIGSLEAAADGAGNGPDEQDSFWFTANSDWMLDLTIDLGTATGAVVLLDAIGVGFIGFEVIDEGLTTNIFAAGPGDYIITLVPLGNIGSLAYTADITLVPLPGAFWLFLSAVIASRRFYKPR